MVTEYRALVRERSGNDIQIDNPDREFVAFMEQEINDWKAEKAKRKREDELGEAKSDELIKSITVNTHKAAALPVKTSPKVLELIEKIKEVYGGTALDYDAAEYLLGAANGNLANAMDMYNSETMVSINVIFGARKFTEQFNGKQKGEELRTYLNGKLNVAAGKQIVIRGKSKTAAPFKDYELRDKTLGELGFHGETIIFVEVV